MSRELHHCAVCPRSGELVGILVAGRQLHLCDEHHHVLGDRQPQSFDDLAALFATPGLDRRAGDDRRVEDRRQFPPRPEGRRHDMGRRVEDPSG